RNSYSRAEDQPVYFSPASSTSVPATPSATLEADGLQKIATQFSAQYAGRDGSTGQTYLKLTIGGALAARGITIENWYSTNILGNRDGQVLEIPGVDVTKMHDKAIGLNSMTALTGNAHRIDIRHMPALDDLKEAWDSVLFRDIFGNSGELQIRWKALDTPLAVQSLLDLLRVFLSSISNHGPGIREDLGFFFKHPIGAQARTPEFLLSELLAANNHLLLPGMSRHDLNW
ncbi:inositol-3-phosphate synthase, partial [Rhodococcus erythropolis]